MPFAKQSNFPQKAADIQILFKGLLLLKPQGRACYVAVLNALNHEFSIKITERGSDKTIAPPPKISCPLTITAGGHGVKKFLNNTFQEQKTDDPRDFRWVVDFKAFHKDAGISPSTSALLPGITLSDGLLYSAVPTDPTFKVMLKHGAGPSKDWVRIAAAIGANIYLKSGENLVLQWGDKQTLSLPRTGDMGNGYRIEISNEPPLATPAHDEFAAYYEAITPPVLGPDRFVLEVTKVKKAFGLDAPCMSGTIDGGGRNGG